MGTSPAGCSEENLLKFRVFVQPIEPGSQEEVGTTSFSTQLIGGTDDSDSE